MIYNFNLNSSYEEHLNFSGSVLKTNIPASRDYQAKVTLFDVTTKESLPVPVYKTVIDNKKITILFESYVSKVDVRVQRMATLRLPLNQNIHAPAYITSWLDNVIEVLQDVAIDRYLKGQGNFIFSRGKKVTYLSPSRVRTVVTKAVDTGWLWGKRTIGLISQCVNRPEKVDNSMNTYTNTLDTEYEVKHSIAIKELQDIGVTDKNTGVSILGGGYTFVKDIANGQNVLTIKLHKTMFSGINVLHKLENSPLIVVYIGGQKINCQMTSNYKEFILTGESAEVDILESNQPIAIELGGERVPMLLTPKIPLTPLITECGNTEVGEQITVAEWA